MAKKYAQRKLWPKGWPIVALAFVSAVVYSSWPLGYYLNPRVGATGYASELGALGQPYNWLFIVGDVLAGLMIILVGLFLWRQYSHKLQGWHKRVLQLFISFGLLTLLAAILPMRCTPSISICAPAWNDTQLLIHDFVSILAGLVMIISVFIIWKRYNHDNRLFSMHFVMAGFLTFGVLSFFYSFIPGPAFLSQRYFLIMCSLWIFMLPLMFVRNELLFKRPRKHVT